MKTRKNLLIVCEGSYTEPEYFYQLRDDLINRGVDYSITIKPKPPTEQLALQTANPQPRPGGRRRQVTNAVVPEEEFMVEEQYLAQPTRYVREAQLGLIDETYDEAWAVYDQDGHAQHPQAVALAAGPDHFVHIGFSSIAFEHWLLLHFEYSTTAFIKSECRQKRTVFNCGQHLHPQDCHGVHCVTGYLKEQGYFPAQGNIKTLGYKQLAHLTNAALEHAYQLRTAQLIANPGVPLYLVNPVTTVDRLVLKLLKEPIDLIWHYEQPVIIGHHSFSCTRTAHQLRVTIINSANAGYIFRPGDFILLDMTGQQQTIFDRFKVDRASPTDKQVRLAELVNFAPVYIGYKLAEDKYAIVEI